MQDGTGRAQDIPYQLGKLTEAVESLEHWLKGNGQEGIIATHDREIDLLKQTVQEFNIRRGMAVWMLRAVGALLVWMWGILVGASTWIPRLHDILRRLGW